MNKIRDSGQCIYNNIRLLLNFIKYYVACLCGYHATTESPMDGTPYCKKSKKAHALQWWNELQILVSRMILRMGIYELANDGKTIEPYGFYGCHACSQESHVLQSWEYVKHDGGMARVWRVSMFPHSSGVFVPLGTLMQQPTLRKNNLYYIAPTLSFFFSVSG